MSTNIGITIGISLISSIVLLTLALIIYNFVNNQPLFTIPWTNENAKLKDNKNGDNNDQNNFNQDCNFNWY